MATRGTPLNFVHLLERMSEPLGYGVRGDVQEGKSMVYFYYDDPKMMNSMVVSNTMKQTMETVRARMTQARSQVPVKMIPVPPTPEKMPNLDLLNFLCPRTVNFSYFIPAHQKAFQILKEAFMSTSNPDHLFQMACSCRDNPMVNNQLFVYAMCSCLVSRRDTRHIRVPSHYEIMPANYCGTDVVRTAHKMAHTPENSNGPQKHVLMVDQNLTGLGTDPEQKMWYFREDILVNSHHFHWHIVFPICSPREPSKEGYRDRRGELFYYMHHSMIARYDTERLCNGLPRTRKFNFANLMLEEAYFSRLSSENSSRQYATRQANTPLADVQVPNLQIKVEELTRWRDRIYESIDVGYFLVKDPQTKKETRGMLDDMNGIDVLGNIVESSPSLTPHAQFYGPIGFHNFGHVLIAHAHDPRSKHVADHGVMGDVAGAMRDPAFYRWHKYIDGIFDYYKQTLPPYSLDNDGKSKFPLRWNGIEVVPQSFYVKALDNQNKNILKTFWDMKEVDLGRGLDFRRDFSTGEMKKTPVTGLFTHLNHGQFEYFLKIDNKTGKNALATVRIFMAPKHNENGDEFLLDEQRLLFFEMDKVSKQLKPGVNDIRLSSTDSSVTLRDENGSSFNSIEKLYREAKSRDDVINESQCSCGWPQHLLLPRGSAGGTEFDLFVIVTDGSQDMVNVSRSKGCNSAFSFCGVLDQKYPDVRPMGYPFDRISYSIKNSAKQEWTEACHDEDIPVPTLKMYVDGIKNSAVTKVTIIHENFMKKDISVMQSQVMSPDGRCVQIQDIYPMHPDMNKGGMGMNMTRPGSGYSQWPKGKNQQNNVNRPSRLDAQQRQEYDQDQWGGVGGYNGRRAREPDDDWEHLQGDYES